MSVSLPASLSAPETQLISDGLSVLSSGLTAAKLGVNSFFAAGETAVPKFGQDVIPAVGSVITRLCPPAAQPFAEMILGVADAAAAAALPPLTKEIVSGLASFASQIDAELDHLGTLL